MSISLENVSKTYGTNAVVRNISLEIQSGEMFVLLGPSGSGKSTLLRMIAGLSRVDEGRIYLQGRDVTHLPIQKRETGFVFQNYSLFQHMTAAQNIAFGLEIKRVPKKERQERVQQLLELIGLKDMGNRMPSQLSGGQQQRVAVARALAPRPEVLLLDEPFGALDVKIRTQLRQNLREIQKALNVTAILVTHDQDEAFELADRIGVIDHGDLLEVGTPDELYRHPKHRFTATFLGSTNLIPAHRNGTALYVGDSPLPVPPDTEHFSGQMVDMMTRPESIDVALKPADLRGHVLGQGVVLSMAFAGAMERVTIQMANTEQNVSVLMNLNRTRELGLRPGDHVWLGVRDYHLLPAAQN
jgi:sulfate/thiosulfate transport system ATP-binding protein